MCTVRRPTPKGFLEYERPWLTSQKMLHPRLSKKQMPADLPLTTKTSKTSTLSEDCSCLMCDRNGHVAAMLEVSSSQYRKKAEFSVSHYRLSAGYSLTSCRFSVATNMLSFFPTLLNFFCLCTRVMAANAYLRY